MGKLTDAAIRKAKRGPSRYKLIDSERRGRGRLICRIEPSGAKVFFFRYRTDDADRLILIGQYDPEGKAWSLAKAIDRARELGERLKTTPDLKEALELEAKREQAERRAELLQVKEGERQTLRALLNVYVAHLERGEKKLAARDAKGIFTKHVLEAFPRVADMPAAEVQARDIAEMMRRLIDKKHDRTAGKLRSYVSAAYALALRAESDPKAPADALAFRLPGNPAAATKAHSGVQARTRTLSEAELRVYMERIAKLPDIQRDALALLLLLGGQRPAQLLRVKTTDVDLLGRRISLFDPKGRRSTPRPHVLPLEQA
ncbi:MAG TPA: Arm DNA-binding domain-containing protein, partial [Burkholderiaceae bacterium]|nr:Arm DNA-binding domain-containing protein [Burkholderiaceae bacterium]